MNTPGWVRVECQLPGVSTPLLTPAPSPFDFGVSGYALKFISGAQFVDQAIFTKESAESSMSHAHDFYDGRVIACPDGFKKFALRARADNPIGVNQARVVVEVLQVPAVLLVESSGLEGQTALRILPTDLISAGRLHPLTGESVHVSIPAGVCARVASLVGDDLFDDRGDMPTNKYRSRCAGGERGIWFPSKSLFLHGFLCTNQAWDVTVWYVALHIDSTGNRLRLPFHKMLAASWTALTPPAEIGYYTPGASVHDSVLHLTIAGTASQVGIPIPANGIEIWVQNNELGAVSITGCIAARGQ